MAIIGVIINFLVGFGFLTVLVRSRENQKDNLKDTKVFDFMPVVLAGTVSIPFTIALQFLMPDVFMNLSGIERDFGTALLSNVVVTGPIEETAKFLTFLLVVKKIRSPRDHFDHLILGALVSLGFALVENIGYIAIFGWDVIFIRSILSIPGHMIFGFIWSLVYGWLRLDSKVHNVQVIPFTFLYGVLPAAFLHGLFNASFWVISETVAIFINVGIQIGIIVIGLKIRDFSPFQSKGKNYYHLKIEELKQTIVNEPSQHEARLQLTVELIKQGELNKAWKLLHEGNYWKNDAGLLALSAFLSTRKNETVNAEDKLKKAFKLDRTKVVHQMDKWVLKLNNSTYVRYEMQKWFSQFKRDNPASPMKEELKKYPLLKFLLGIVLGFIVTFITFSGLAPFLGQSSIFISVTVVGFMIFGALRSKDLSWRPFYYGVGSTVFLVQSVFSIFFL
jgi:RsiW-degrading membrane proteinase PrsW (M82 family)